MHQGSCQCGAVRYQFNGEPLTCYACHCTDCQTSSGSAFGLSMVVNSNDLEAINGELAINTRDLNGTEVRRHYCEQCGTDMWYSADSYPSICALKPGTFDDTSWFKPVAHFWMRSAQPWVLLDEVSAKYEKQPEIGELIELWAKQNTA